MSESTEKILWTGGWDSTYLILKALFMEAKTVQPYYLIDEKRKSLRQELLAIKRIRLRILQQAPALETTLLPLRVYTVSSIPSDTIINTSYDAIRKAYRLGTQYRWLANFCEHERLSNVQLGIVKDTDSGQVGSTSNIVESLLADADENQSYRTIDPKYAGTDEYNIFKYYNFPLIRTTKQEIMTTVDDGKWGDIMNCTWFCHTPTVHGRPCGACVPCKTSRKEGLGHRIPAWRRYLGMWKR